MKRSLTKKQQSRLGICLMLLLSSGVIGIGLLASVWMDRLVPTFIGEAVHIRDNDAAPPLFSWNDNINLSIYPWSQYNASKSRPVNSDEKELLRSAMLDSYIYSILGEREDRSDDGLLGQFVINEEAGDREGYFYLKDATVAMTDGRRFIVNCAAFAADGEIAYLHYKDVEAGEATREELNVSYRKLEGFLEEFYGAYAFIDGKDEVERNNKEQILPVEEEVFAFFENMMAPLEFWQVEAQERKQIICADTLLYAIQNGLTEPELLSADAELLLIYTLDIHIRMILFVEPRSMSFAGYSIQME